MIVPEGCEVYIWTSSWVTVVGCNCSGIFDAREILGSHGEKGEKRKKQLFFEAWLFNKHTSLINKSGNLFCYTVPVWVGLRLHTGAWQHGCLTHQIYSIKSAICWMCQAERQILSALPLMSRTVLCRQHLTTWEWNYYTTEEGCQCWPKWAWVFF